MLTFYFVAKGGHEVLQSRVGSVPNLGPSEKVGLCSEPELPPPQVHSLVVVQEGFILFSLRPDFTPLSSNRTRRGGDSSREGEAMPLWDSPKVRVHPQYCMRRGEEFSPLCPLGCVDGRSVALPPCWQGNRSPGMRLEKSVRSKCGDQ